MAWPALRSEVPPTRGYLNTDRHDNAAPLKVGSTASKAGR
jgi:hypothetical protein